ncbi:conserved domain protein [Sulfurihydrogenibium azorense Az-Fu1]|uniref:Conserved domain protein n=2 Tax=Sulfurihydrogenibium azorense TaxID=309806 RepID=C1DX07_SULAA|nr:conserved domain protein [Sulfurihydrogenibium azorense Az-Fu1]
MSMKKFILALGSVFLFSCGGMIKDVSFETGDYLGTGYDEKPQKKITIQKESKEKQQTEKKSFLSALSSAVVSDSDDDEDMSDIYERSTNMSYQELDLLLRTELENANFKIVHVLNITNGVEEQGVKDFWKHMHIYLVCKLSECSKILKHNPQLASQFPIRVYTYEKDGRLIVGVFKPSMAIKYMGNLDAEGIKALKTLDREIKKVIDSVTK